MRGDLFEPLVMKGEESAVEGVSAFLGGVSVVIPALDEEESVGVVVSELLELGVGRVVVVDNGSADATAEVARGAGGVVLYEEMRGYGAACLRGLSFLDEQPAAPLVVAFVDADLSDVPAQLWRVLYPLYDGSCELVIGTRALGKRTEGALLPQARFGNVLATSLLEAAYGYGFTDLGPLRAMTWRSFRSLGMRDRDFGWTVELQARAAKARLRVLEVPVDYRARVGHSKITGTLSGTWRAGVKILGTIGALLLGDEGLSGLKL